MLASFLSCRVKQKKVESCRGRMSFSQSFVGSLESRMLLFKQKLIKRKSYGVTREHRSPDDKNDNETFFGYGR